MGDSKFAKDVNTIRNFFFSISIIELDLLFLLLPVSRIIVIEKLTIDTPFDTQWHTDEIIYGKFISVYDNTVYDRRITREVNKKLC